MGPQVLGQTWSWGAGTDGLGRCWLVLRCECCCSVAAVNQRVPPWSHGSLHPRTGDPPILDQLSGPSQLLLFWLPLLGPSVRLSLSGLVAALAVLVSPTGTLREFEETARMRDMGMGGHW